MMNVEIAQRLAELRRERGFSQEGLAEQLGLSRQAVSKWERAESAPDMGNLIALADLYDVTLDELLRVSPEVADDVRYESRERAESAETQAAEAVAEAREAADRAEAAAAQAAEAPEAPKVVVEVSAPSVSPSGFPPPTAVPPHIGMGGQQTSPGFVPPASGMPCHYAPAPGSGMPPRGAFSYPSSAIPPAPVPSAAPPAPPQPKDPLQSFPYPLLCAVIFLLVGFCFGWWHPGWVIFLTIPFYYWIVNTLQADPAYRAWRAERQQSATAASAFSPAPDEGAPASRPAPAEAGFASDGFARSASGDSASSMAGDAISPGAGVPAESFAASAADAVVGDDSSSEGGAR